MDIQRFASLLVHNFREVALIAMGPFFLVMLWKLAGMIIRAQK
ncbi:MAG: hypothetical protein M0018_03890 [Nitrospiraceae bacterium]|nr:hypothetical protein [Nitrospiraceae bacterium]